MLSLRNVALVRGSRVLVSDLNLDARSGELIALRGPSGSGKTTILRAIAGLDPFDGGTIDIGDARLEARRTPDRATFHRLRRNVGFVFQFHCLFEHMSALENVCLAPIHVYGRAPLAAAQSARDLLSQFGVELRADARPRELSGGEAQRVAIARAGAGSSGVADGRADGVARPAKSGRAGRAASTARGERQDVAGDEP